MSDDGKPQARRGRPPGTGGMTWFRHYHGTMNDPKFRLIAHRAKEAPVVVLSVWSALMEHASSTSPRGTLAGWDDEVVAFNLSMETERLIAVRSEMMGRPNSPPLTMCRHCGTWSRSSLAPSGSRPPLLDHAWQPNEESRALAVERGVDPKLSADEFRNYWVPGGLPGDEKEKRKRDWDQAFRSRVLDFVAQGRFPLRPPGEQGQRSQPPRVATPSDRLREMEENRQRMGLAPPTVFRAPRHGF